MRVGKRETGDAVDGGEKACTRKHEYTHIKEMQMHVSGATGIN